MTADDQIEECPRCGKPLPLCICDTVTPIENRIELVILQHPQEQDRALGTARLTVQHFAKAQLKVGLSWPSLNKVLGREADAQRWAILYLGSVHAAEVAAGQDVVVVDRNGALVEGQKGILRDIEGVIVLDGTWSQAKALWWRNAWMLKCRRIILEPKAPSRYGNLRKEPRSDGLSTLEAAGMLIARLEHKPAIETVLGESFERMLTRFREVQKSNPELAPRPKKKDWRRSANKRRAPSA